MKCAKCGADLEESGVIKIKVPVFFKGEFIDFYLCRDHFLESDNMSAGEFRKWIHKKVKK